MREYNEGGQAFWNGKKITDNPYLGGSTENFRNWRLGFLYAQTVSRMREEEVNA